MVEQTADQARLEALFERADIDDITLDPLADISERVELVITERVTGDSHQVAASTLEGAIEEALITIDDRQAFRQLRLAGFNGSDIADLVGRPDLADLDAEYDRTPEGEAWQRGYEAGAVETAEIYAESFSARMSAIVKSITASPAAAAVGEPVDNNGIVNALRVIPIDGAYLALVMPTQIATD